MTLRRWTDLAYDLLQRDPKIKGSFIKKRRKYYPLAGVLKYIVDTELRDGKGKGGSLSEDQVIHIKPLFVSDPRFLKENNGWYISLDQPLPDTRYSEELTLTEAEAMSNYRQVR